MTRPGMILQRKQNIWTLQKWIHHTEFSKSTFSCLPPITMRCQMTMRCRPIDGLVRMRTKLFSPDGLDFTYRWVQYRSSRGSRPAATSSSCFHHPFNVNDAMRGDEMRWDEMRNSKFVVVSPTDRPFNVNDMYSSPKEEHLEKKKKHFEKKKH